MDNHKTAGVINTLESESNILYGDLNNDGIINIVDMIYLKSYIVEKNKDNLNVITADLNDDGEISRLDVCELTKYFMSKIESLGPNLYSDSDGDGLNDYMENQIL